MSKRGGGFSPAWRTLAVAAAVAAGGASLTVIPGRTASTRVVVEEPGVVDPAQNGGAVEPGPARPGARDPQRPADPRRPGAQALQCVAGRNGGATDVGVTANQIKFGATVVESGIGASFLGQVRHAMAAVKNKVNASGGVCGRRIETLLVDDGWRSREGAEFLQNLVEQDNVFALAVVPSSEGLKRVSDIGYLRDKGVPVVGSDGMLIGQYTDPVIWPVAASTISTMHIMVKQAYDAGARHFGIVYERTYHFGLEGAFAFNAAVKRVTGSDVPGYSNPLTSPECAGRFCAIVANAGSYTTQNEVIASACGKAPECDFVALLLEPSTAIDWMKGTTLTPTSRLRMGGVQPLFTRQFANACSQKCHNLWLWTGYYPPLGEYLQRPAVARYVDEILATNRSADYNNPFVQGGYIGMSLLVEALRRTGPDLTRKRLMAVLDAMTFDSGLTDPLRWRPGNHFANVRMRAFSIQYKSGVATWRDERTTLTDPWVGKDIPSQSSA